MVRRRFLLLGAFLACVALSGCATLESLDQGLYDASAAVAPTHPVTGRPVLNLVSQDDEIALAAQIWEHFEKEAVAKGAAVDPPGPRLRRIRTIFLQLLGVAHRQDLPWDVHLIEDGVDNAFAVGGGLVVIHGGLFGGLVPANDDEALAAVLAHEIAHVTLLHTARTITDLKLRGAFSDRTKDRFYFAAYRTEQEDEADKLSVLYLALAGFDPNAAAGVWLRAHQMRGSSAARTAYLHDHSLNAERAQRTYQAAAIAAQYRVPGQRNPDWETLLESNVLIGRTDDWERATAGSGVLRTLEVTGKAVADHQRVKVEQKQREEAAKALYSGVQIVSVRYAPTSSGYMGVFVNIQNVSAAVVERATLSVDYVGSSQAILAKDEGCAATGPMHPGQTVQIGCYLRNVPGYTAVNARISNLQFR